MTSEKYRIDFLVSPYSSVRSMTLEGEVVFRSGRLQILDRDSALDRSQREAGRRRRLLVRENTHAAVLEGSKTLQA